MQTKTKTVYLTTNNIRDCSLFMAKGGSVIFNQFRHMKNLPLPESGYFKKLPPVYVTGSKFYPPSPTLRTRRAYNCVAYNMCSGRVPINQNQVQGHLWSYSMEALSKESKFAAPALTCAQRRSDSREKSTVGKFARSSLQGLNQFCCLRMAIYLRTTIL